MDPPRRRANKRKGHGTYASDPPPIISGVPRDAGEQRFGVCGHADTRTCAALSAENVPARSTRLYTDEWQSSRGSHSTHCPARHGVQEWARDDDGDGRCEVHCHTCEGAGAALQAYLCAFRGVHKRYLHLYVATYEAMVNTKRVTPTVIRRMGIYHPVTYTMYT